MDPSSANPPRGELQLIRARQEYETEKRLAAENEAEASRMRGFLDMVREHHSSAPSQDNKLHGGRMMLARLSDGLRTGDRMSTPRRSNSTRSKHMLQKVAERLKSVKKRSSRKRLPILLWRRLLKMSMLRRLLKIKTQHNKFNSSLRRQHTTRTRLRN